MIFIHVLQIHKNPKTQLLVIKIIDMGWFNIFCKIIIKYVVKKFCAKILLMSKLYKESQNMNDE